MVRHPTTLKNTSAFYSFSHRDQSKKDQKILEKLIQRYRLWCVALQMAINCSVQQKNVQSIFFLFQLKNFYSFFFFLFHLQKNSFIFPLLSTTKKIILVKIIGSGSSSFRNWLRLQGERNIIFHLV